MESDISSCGICFESYNEAKRKPLLLPCSHSFCQTCLQTLENEGRKDCAFCKKTWRPTAVNNFPICYQLIPEGAFAQSKPKVETCGQHGKEITFWCKSCSLAICNTCLEEKHKKCKFVEIQTFRDSKSQKDYEKLVSEVRENMSQNDELIRVFRSFANELENQTENCQKWKQKSQTSLDKFEEYRKKREVGSAGLQNTQKRKETQEAFETINKEAPIKTLLFHIAKSYKKTPDHRVEEFMKHLQQSVEKNRSASSSSATKTKKEVSVCTFQSDEVWTIKDSPAVIEATRVLRSTCARPSDLEVAGLNWTHNELIRLLIEVSEVRCPVRVRFLDTFWNPGKKSVEQTVSRLQTLLKPSCRCTVKEFWAHLNADAVNKLPDTIDSVGLVLTSAEDLQAIKALLDVERIMWVRLTEINLCFTQSFKEEVWTLDREPNSAGHRLAFDMTITGISLGLHFPFLKLSGLEWMRVIIRKITEDFQYKGIIKKIYLPGSYITAQDFLSSLKDCGLRCEVHLPESPLQNSKEALEQSYHSIECSVIWDLEPVGSFCCEIM